MKTTYQIYQFGVLFSFTQSVCGSSSAKTALSFFFFLRTITFIFTRTKIVEAPRIHTEKGEMYTSFQKI